MKLKPTKLRLALACVKDETADVNFWLSGDKDGIHLNAKGKSGSQQIVMIVNPDGLFRRIEAFDTGLPKDNKGRVKFKRGY